MVRHKPCERLRKVRVLVWSYARSLGISGRLIVAPRRAAEAGEHLDQVRGDERGDPICWARRWRSGPITTSGLYAGQLFGQKFVATGGCSCQARCWTSCPRSGRCFTTWRTGGPTHWSRSLRERRGNVVRMTEEPNQVVKRRKCCMTDTSWRYLEMIWDEDHHGGDTSQAITVVNDL
jgi:hypothetical protein